MCYSNPNHTIPMLIVWQSRGANLTELKVFSSIMLRSIETALHNFEGKDVYPTPWIAESGGGADNKPMAWGDQLTTIMNRGDEDLLKHVIYGKKGGIAAPNAQDLKDARFYSNYDEFLKFFPGMLKVSTIKFHSLNCNSTECRITGIKLGSVLFLKHR